MEERSGNIGYIMMTLREDECRVEIGLRNVENPEIRNCRWYAVKEQEKVLLETFPVREGQADFYAIYPKNRIGKARTPREGWKSFVFEFDDGSWGKCNISGQAGENNRKETAGAIRTYIPKEIRQEKDSIAAVLRNESSSNKTGGEPPPWKEDSFTETGGKSPPSRENAVNGRQPLYRNEEKTSGQPPPWNEKRPLTLWEEEEETLGCETEEMFDHEAEDKENEQQEEFQEFMKQFPVLQPFPSQGNYVQITPFAVKYLAPDFQSMAQNSFLLHGYYTYHHLILGYYRDERKCGYYLGVPGTFQEREQMLAGMFGFEGYEHSGNLGYYMKRVELGKIKVPAEADIT
ncbi:MAG: hypothetical protein ACI4DU_02455 [Lachnospiraceae bacterium]